MGTTHSARGVEELHGGLTTATELSTWGVEKENSNGTVGKIRGDGGDQGGVAARIIAKRWAGKDYREVRAGAVVVGTAAGLGRMGLMREDQLAVEAPVESQRDCTVGV